MVDAGTVIYTWYLELNGNYLLSMHMTTEIQRVLSSGYFQALFSAVSALTATG
jgi:hypothetical protein